jgi:hypothetical protein
MGHPRAHPSYASLIAKLVGLVVLAVAANTAAYLVLLPVFFSSRATYWPAAAILACTLLFAGALAWKSGAGRRTAVMQGVSCLASALVAGCTATFLTLLILLNTVGS